MKIDDRMRYPHPVLQEGSRDYSSGAFVATFEHSISTDDTLTIVSSLALSQGELTALVDSGKAGVGYFAVCRRTFFNRLFAVGLGRVEQTIPLSALFGAVSLRPAIWTVARLDGISIPAIHREFGNPLSIPAGVLLAVGPEFQLSVDPQKFKPFESIFSLEADDRVPAGEIRVDPNNDCILIVAGAQTHATLTQMRNLPVGRTVLLSSVYLPAVAEVIAALQVSNRAYTAYRWYRVLRAKCDDIGIDPIAPSASPIELAQRLLRAPLASLLSAMENT